MENKELKLFPKHFWIIFIFIGSNLASLSIFNIYINQLRFIRQPFLLICLAATLHYLPLIRNQKQIPVLTFAFYSFVFYFIFNLITSLDPVNSVVYGSWMILSLIFLYQLIFARCGLSFKQLLYILSVSILIIGELSIVISLVGAYVFDFSEFFDERYNFSNMKMTRELAGVFGSNNTLGMVTFLIQVFYISLFLLFKPANKYGLLFLAFIHTGLILFIGNRASMFCGVLIWLGFFLYVNRSFIGTFVLLSSLFLGFIVFNEAILKKLRIEQFEDGNLFGNRSQLINEAVQVVQQMDFFGVGFQNQRLSRRHFGVESAEEKELNFHNTYLAVVAELGFLGLLWIPGLLIFYLLKSPEYEANEEELKIFRFLKLLILVLLLVYLPVEDSINSPGSPMFAIFWLMFFTLIKGLCESPTLKSYEPIQNKNSLSNHSV